ncbi:hypothetical protein HJFPF1_04975 [Paramyrothecium foliicola]|nr:hypothetical protein HJFPF1_04975 [Paramyrothecium foliicola]
MPRAIRAACTLEAHQDRTETKTGEQTGICICIYTTKHRTSHWRRAPIRAMSSRIPPLLEPYLALPTEAALILVTSVLGASSNWLVLRYLCSYLKAKGQRGAPEGEDGPVTEDVGVVLVSFLRDAAFWREGAGKLGLDLDTLSKAGRFAYVDGLTGLFTGEAGGSNDGSRRVLRSSKVADVAAVIEASLGDVRTSKRILIVDQLDLLLAATEDDVTSLALQNMLLSLRERAHATILTVAADAPLVHAQATTLEREHAALALGLAHEADTLLSLRMLDTGTARDVSGVVRVTAQQPPGDDEPDAGEREFLYYVAGDGAVKVFERGT